MAAANLSLLRRWIEQGALFDGSDPNRLLSELIPRQHPAPPARYTRATPARALAFSANGEKLFVSGYHEVLVFDLATQQVQVRLPDTDEQIFAIVPGVRSNHLAVAAGAPGRSGEFLLLSLAGDSPPQILARLPDVALTIAHHTARHELVGAGADHVIRVFDLSTARQILAVEGHADWVTDLIVAGDNGRLVSASRDRSVRIFNPTDGKLLLSYLEHEQPVFALAPHPHPDRIHSADGAGQIHCWELSTGKKLGSARTGTTISRLQLLGDKLYAAGIDGQIREFATGDEPRLLRSLQGLTDAAFSLAAHPDRNWLAAGSYDGRILVWSLPDATVVAELSAEPGPAANP